MNIPIIIMSIEANVCLEIFSAKKIRESIGTKIYPEDPKIGISLRFTPYFSPMMLIRVDPKKIE